MEEQKKKRTDFLSVKQEGITHGVIVEIN